MAQGAAAPLFGLFAHTPGNPQLPVLPNPSDPKTGIANLFASGGSINAPRFPTSYLEVLGGAPGPALGFAQTWLNQIGIAPNPLDFGNITGDKTLTATVHNTNRTPCTVTAVDLSAFTGITLDDPGLPVVVGAFASQVFTFTATLLGEVAFDDLALFSTTCGDLTLRLIGRRVIILDMFPQRPITEKLTFLTDNLISDDGTEQTMSLRIAPRSSIDTFQRFTDNEERTRHQNVLLGAAFLPIGAQQWWQARQLTSAALAVDTVIQVSTIDMEIEVGGTVGFVLADRTSLEGEVLSFTATDVTLTQAIGVALPRNTEFMGIKFGFMNRKANLAAFAVNAEDTKVTFELIDYPNIGAVDPAYFELHPTDGKPIVTDCLFFNGRQRKAGITSTQDRLDGLTGQIRQSRTEALSRPSQSLLVHINSLADQHAWRTFLHFVRGSWASFYVPTGTNDLPLSVDFNLGSNVLIVPNMGLATLIGNVAPRRDVRVTVAGVEYFRRIASVVDNGATETVTLDSVIPGAGTVPIANMFVSWLTLSRIASDTATFKHLYRGIAELRFQVRGVIDGV